MREGRIPQWLVTFIFYCWSLYVMPAKTAKPVKPKITNCIVHNWETMTCYWRPPHDTQLFWYLCHRKSPQVCELPSPGNCTWRDMPTLRTCLIVIYKNDPQLIDEYNVTPTTIVKPDAPKDVAVRNQNRRGIQLYWKSPKYSYNIKYWVTYQSEWDQLDNVWHVQNVTTEDMRKREYTHWITGLTPNSHYRLWITCRPYEDGYNSDPSTVAEARTSEDVPWAAPQIVQGALWVTGTDDNGARTINIYWNDIEEKQKNGNITKYMLCGTCLDECHHFTSGEYLSYSISVPEDRACEVTLNAATRIGYNTSLDLEPLLIPGKPDMPEMPQRLYAVSDGDTERASKVKVAWDIRESSMDNVTVFYCKGSKTIKMCTKPNQLFSKTVPYPRGFLMIDLAQDRESVDKYIFGAAVIRNSSSGKISSGIKWISCTHPSDKEPDVPRNVAVREEQQGENSLHLSWDVGDCLGHVGGYTDRYVIKYCTAEFCPGSCEEISDCQKCEELAFERSEQNSYTIQNLEVSKKYYVAMKAVTPFQLESDYSAPPALGKFSSSWLSIEVLFGICVAAVIVFICLIFGIYRVVKHLKRKIQNATSLAYQLPKEVNISDSDLNDRQDLDYIPGMEKQGIAVLTDYRMLSENKSNKLSELPDKYPIGDWPLHHQDNIVNIENLKSYLKDSSSFIQVPNHELEDNNTPIRRRSEVSIHQDRLTSYQNETEHTSISSQNSSQCSSVDKNSVTQLDQSVSESSLPDSSTFLNTNSMNGSETGSLQCYIQAKVVPESDTSQQIQPAEGNMLLSSGGADIQ